MAGRGGAGKEPGKVGLGGAQRGEGGWGRAGQGRLGRGGAVWGASLTFHNLLSSKKRGLSAFASADLCVSLKRGAAAALSWPRDPELAATEFLCPGLPWPARAGSHRAGKRAQSGRGSPATSYRFSTQHQCRLGQHHLESKMRTVSSCGSLV